MIATPTHGELMRALREIGGHEETPDDFLWLKNDADHCFEAWPDRDGMADGLVDSGFVYDTGDATETHLNALDTVAVMCRLVERNRVAS